MGKSEMPRVTDWRDDPAVIAARGELAEVERRVGDAERQVAAALGEVKALEAQQDEVVEQIVANKAVTSDLFPIRAALGRAKARAEALTAECEPLYGEFAAARAKAEAAEAPAKAASWSSWLAAYVVAGDRLGAALPSVIDLEAEVVGLYRQGCALFGDGGGWVKQPDGPERVGNGSFNHRRLSQPCLDDWRAWRVDCGAVDEGAKRRRQAEKVAAEARKLIEETERDDRNRELAEAERAKMRWHSTRDLSGGKLVKVSWRGSPPVGGPNDAA